MVRRILVDSDEEEEEQEEVFEDREGRQVLQSPKPLSSAPLTRSAHKKTHCLSSQKEEEDDLPITLRRTPRQSAIQATERINRTIYETSGPVLNPVKLATKAANEEEEEYESSEEEEEEEEEEEDMSKFIVYSDEEEEEKERRRARRRSGGASREKKVETDDDDEMGDFIVYSDEDEEKDEEVSKRNKKDLAREKRRRKDTIQHGIKEEREAEFEEDEEEVGEEVFPVKRLPTTIHIDDDEEDENREEAEGGGTLLSQERSNAPLSQQSVSRRRRIVVLDDEEEEEEEKKKPDVVVVIDKDNNESNTEKKSIPRRSSRRISEEKSNIPSPAVSLKRRRVEAVLNISDEDDLFSVENESGNEEEKGEEEEEEEDEEEGDEGYALYWRVDNELSSNKEPVAQAAEKNLTLDDYFERYIEMMAKVHIDPEALKVWRKFPNSKESLRFTTAAHKVPTSENGFCNACKRSNHPCPYHICLYGSAYDAKRCWEATLWDQHLPEGLLYHKSNGHSYDNDGGLEESADDSGDQEEEVNPFNVQDPNVLYDRDFELTTPNRRASFDRRDSSSSTSTKRRNLTEETEVKWWEGRIKCPHNLLKQKESLWTLSSTCHMRTKMYHAMLHYKFRLMLKVRNKLDAYGGSISMLMADTNFIQRETERFQSSMNTALMWKGHGAVTDIWNDNDQVKNKNKKAKNCRVASTRASSSGGIKLETNIEIDNSLAASEGRFQSAVKDATTRLLV